MSKFQRYYHCDNHKPVLAENAKEAVYIFIKRKYPKCDHFIVNQHAYTLFYTTFKCFAGKYNKKEKCSVGENDIFITVRF